MKSNVLQVSNFYNQWLYNLQVKYIQIFRKMEQCYDQVVHPQKRILLRHLLDGVTGRVLELKNELVGLDFHEVHYLDDILQDMKLTPADLEMPIPKYYRVERAKVSQNYLLRELKSLKWMGRIQVHRVKVQSFNWIPQLAIHHLHFNLWVFCSISQVNYTPPPPQIAMNWVMIQQTELPEWLIWLSNNFLILVWLIHYDNLN